MRSQFASDLVRVAAESTRPPSTVGLSMIVRDESAVIERCLASARPFIHAWTIVDTGSTDDTQAIVRDCLADLPGTLHERPWRDFGTNRTELLELAQGSAEYLLLLDADQTLHGGALPSLWLDAYHVRHDDEPQMWIPRVLRSGLPWRFVGATHEHLACDIPYRTARLDEVVVRHHADGGVRAGKLRRDLELLERAVLEDPSNARSLFYLAQTYRDLERIDDAIEMYERSTELAGWDEQTFYARYQAAALTSREDPEAGIPLLMDAWELRPSRLEPLYDLAVAARRAGRPAMALLATAAGRHLPSPDDLLFVHRWMYEWGIRLEHALALGELDQHWDAIGVASAVCQDRRLSPEATVDALLTRQWIVDQLWVAKGQEHVLPDSELVSAARLGRLPLLADLVGETTSVGLGIPVEGVWSPTNPSIAAGPSGFALVVRAVNSRLNDEGLPEPADGGRVIANRTFLQVHGADGAPLTIVELREPPDRPRLPAGVVGFEDCRLFWWRGAWHLVANCREVSHDALERMVLLRIDDDQLADLVVFPGQVTGRREKNWMPFVVDDRLLLVYGCHPFVVVEWDPDAGRLRERCRIATPTSFAAFGGGSQGVPVEGGHLFVVHQVERSGTRRLYEHRLFQIDDELRPVALSRPFALQRYGVEFCAGMAAWGDDLLLSYGTQDQRAWLASVDAVDLLGLLEPVVLPAGPPG